MMPAAVASRAGACWRQCACAPQICTHSQQKVAVTSTAARQGRWRLAIIHSPAHVSSPNVLDVPCSHSFISQEPSQHICSRLPGWSFQDPCNPHPFPNLGRMQLRSSILCHRERIEGRASMTALSMHWQQDDSAYRTWLVNHVISQNIDNIDLK